jgi:hypothetical protein
MIAAGSYNVNLMSLTNTPKLWNMKRRDGTKQSAARRLQHRASPRAPLQQIGWFTGSDKRARGRGGGLPLADGSDAA